MASGVVAGVVVGVVIGVVVGVVVVGVVVGGEGGGVVIGGGGVGLVSTIKNKRIKGTPRINSGRRSDGIVSVARLHICYMNVCNYYSICLNESPVEELLWQDILISQFL